MPFLKRAGGLTLSDFNIRSYNHPNGNNIKLVAWVKGTKQNPDRSAYRPVTGRSVRGKTGLFGHNY